MKKITSVIIILNVILFINCGSAPQGARDLENQARQFERQRNEVGVCQSAIIYSELAKLYLTDGNERKSRKFEKKAQSNAQKCSVNILRFWNNYTGCTNPIQNIATPNYYIWGSNWLEIARYYNLQTIVQAIETGRARWQQLCPQDFNSTTANETNILTQAQTLGTAPALALNQTTTSTSSQTDNTQRGLNNTQLQAIQSILNQNYPEAYNLLSKLMLVSNQNTPQNHILIGYCMERMGQIEQARQEYSMSSCNPQLSTAPCEPQFGQFMTVYLQKMAESTQQPQDRINKAREIYQQATQLADNSQYNEAVLKFIESYNIVPHPATLYNIGITYEANNQPYIALIYFVLISHVGELRDRVEEGINRIINPGSN